MSIFKIEKVIGSVPETLSPDSLYLVRTGAGFDLYASDTTGAIAHSLNSVGSNAPDLLNLPEAEIAPIDALIVIQEGQLRKISMPDLLGIMGLVYVDESTYVAPTNTASFVYDESTLIYGDVYLLYPDPEVLTHSDEILYLDTEMLLYGSSAVPDNAIYVDGEPIPDIEGLGYLTF